MGGMLGRCPACLSSTLTLLVLMVGGIASSYAQSSPGETLASERSLLAGSFAAEKLWVWQKRLNLEEWKISVVVVRAGDLKAKTVGNIHWDRDKKTAVIKVLDPADYNLPLPASRRAGVGRAPSPHPRPLPEGRGERI